MIFLYSCFFLFGNLAVQLSSQLPGIWPWYGACIVFVLLSCLTVIWRNRCFVLVLCFLAGYLYTVGWAQTALNHQLPAKFEHKTITIIASVNDLVVKHPKFCTVPAKSKLLGQLRINWYQASCPAPGSTWRLSVKCHRARNYANPGHFDKRAWSLAKGINAFCYVKNKPRPILLNTPKHYSLLKFIPGGLPRALNRWGFQRGEAELSPLVALRGFIPRCAKLILILRYQLLQFLQRHTSDTNALRFLSAIILGYRGLLEAPQWQILQATGTNHLVAVAGLHLGFVAMIFYGIFYFAWRCSSTLCLYIPAKRIAKCAALFGALTYTLLSGLSLPTLRALIMLSIAILALLSNRRVDLLNVLAIALFSVLLWDPMSTLSISFYLSFAAVFFIVWYFRHRQQHVTAGWFIVGIEHFKIQLLLLFCLTPILIISFGNISLISLIANILTIPLMGFVILPLCFITLILLPFQHDFAVMVLSLADRFCVLLWKCLALLAQIPGASFSWHSSNLFMIICSLLGVGIALLPKGMPTRSFTIFSFLPLYFYAYSTTIPAQLRMTVLDVGQGLSVVLQTKNHNMLYDTGPGFGSFNAGNNMILPFWQAQGLGPLSKLMISHADSDHRGGAKAIINSLHPKTVLTSFPYHYKTQTCLAGDSWRYDNVLFKVLYPSSQDLGKNNDSSCVLLVKTKRFSVLLPGDIEHKAETKLLQRYPKLHVDILLAPHHGSKTSSGVAFVRQLQPSIVIFATGYYNRFHFPHRSVVQRYQAEKSRLYQIDQTGALTIDVGHTISVNAYRWHKRHYWE